jgi:hypothetical protein
VRIPVKKYFFGRCRGGAPLRRYFYKTAKTG